MFEFLNEAITRILSKYSRQVNRLISMAVLLVSASFTLFIGAFTTNYIFEIGRRPEWKAVAAKINDASLPLILIGALTTLVGFAAAGSLFPAMQKKTKNDAEVSLDREAMRILARIRADALPSPSPAPVSRPSTKASPRIQRVPERIGRSDWISAAALTFARNRGMLLAELKRVQGSATQSLYFGIFFSLVSIGLTVYFVMSSKQSVVQIAGVYEFLAYYLPRLSLALLPEVIGLFFLNLSVINQRDVRSIRNEITNVELREIATALALSGSTTKSISTLIDQFSGSERNFILRKGERVLNEADRTERLSAQMRELSNLVVKMAAVVTGRSDTKSKDE